MTKQVAKLLLKHSQRWHGAQTSNEGDTGILVS